MRMCPTCKTALPTLIHMKPILIKYNSYCVTVGFAIYLPQYENKGISNPNIILISL